MSDYVTDQADWVAPAVSGEMLCIAIDATSREYDLGAIALGVDRTKKPGALFYLNLTADGNPVYYTMSAASGKTVDDTAAVTAGGAVAFTANACDMIPANSTVAVYIHRDDHRYLQVKCASGKTATLRVRLSSVLEPGDY